MKIMKNYIIASMLVVISMVVISMVINATSRDESARALWTKELASDAENNWVIPTYIRSTSKVFYNGKLLKPSEWTIISNTALRVNFVTMKYDQVSVIY